MPSYSLSPGNLARKKKERRQDRHKDMWAQKD